MNAEFDEEIDDYERNLQPTYPSEYYDFNYNAGVAAGIDMCGNPELYVGIYVNNIIAKKDILRMNDIEINPNDRSVYYTGFYDSDYTQFSYESCVMIKTDKNGDNLKSF